MIYVVAMALKSFITGTYAWSFETITILTWNDVKFKEFAATS